MGVICRFCNKPLDENSDSSLFEGMHWLCFHLCFEHDGSPDLPCLDPSCLWNQLQELREMAKPSSVVSKSESIPRRTAREIAWDFWAELDSLEEGKLDWKIRSELIETLMKVLATYDGVCIVNDRDLLDETSGSHGVEI